MDAKDEVKQRLSIEEVVADYMELSRVGRNFKALSPFTNERTPSFIVSPEKQIWHDFSSNKGGDIFSFIMEVEGVEFREALELLAKKAGVEIRQFQGDGQTKELKRKMSEALELATQFYHLCLSKNPEALKYIKERRGFSVETIRQWRLGYSPDDGQQLLKFLKQRGFSREVLTKAGLVTERRSGLGDMFRGRIMVPLSDRQGAVVGFTARLLRDDKNAPKYFNTPQTLLYDKGRQVFGYHHAKDSIRKENAAVLVEGNFDVIASHQAGVTNVVAAAGTAMTADHLRSINRLAEKVKLAFDADEAGLKATERAIAIAQDVGIELEVISMPGSAKDPDELISSDPKKWLQATQSAMDAVTWVINRYEMQHDKSTADGKRKLSSKALAVINKIKDPVEREHHLGVVAKYLDISLASLQTKLAQSKNAPIKRKAINADKASPDTFAYEDEFLALNGFYPDSRESLKTLKESMLHGEDRKKLFRELLEAPANLTLTEIDSKGLHEIDDYVKILLLIVEERYRSFNPSEQMSEVMALARRIVQTEKTEKKEQLTEAIRVAESRGEQKKATQLLEEYQNLLG